MNKVIHIEKGLKLVIIDLYTELFTFSTIEKKNPAG